MGCVHSSNVSINDEIKEIEKSSIKTIVIKYNK